MTQADLLPEKKQAALSRALSEFLIEFSIGVHRFAMYPPGHPSLAPAVENVVGRLAVLFEDRRSLAIGWIHDELKDRKQLHLLEAEVDRPLALGGDAR